MQYNNQLTIDPNDEHENNKHNKQHKPNNISRPSVMWWTSIVSDAQYCVKSDLGIFEGES